MVLTAWTEVWTGRPSYRSRSSIRIPMGPGGRAGKIFVILGGTGDINNAFDKYTQLLPHLSSLALLGTSCDLPKLFSLGFVPIRRSRSSTSIVGPGGRSGQIFDLREPSMIHLGNMMMTKPQPKSQYPDLGPHTRDRSIP